MRRNALLMLRLMSTPSAMAATTPMIMAISDRALMKAL